jgi:hypothetical protein
MEVKGGHCKWHAGRQTASQINTTGQPYNEIILYRFLSVSLNSTTEPFSIWGEFENKEFTVLEGEIETRPHSLQTRRSLAWPFCLPLARDTGMALVPFCKITVGEPEEGEARDER